jgi:adenylylsulfate kinase (apsK)
VPGSGKTTLAEGVCARLKGRGLKVEHLDGDKVRDVFPQTGFTKEARDEHIKRIGFMASRLEAHGVSVVASFVSPYREARDFARGLCHNFIEVYVHAPLAVCEKRDPKGLYRKAREGTIKNFTGLGDPYEIPPKPHLTIDTSKVSVDQAVDDIIKTIEPFLA